MVADNKVRVGHFCNQMRTPTGLCETDPLADQTLAHALIIGVRGEALDCASVPRCTPRFGGWLQAYDEFRFGMALVLRGERPLAAGCLSGFRICAVELGRVSVTRRDARCDQERA